MGAQHYRGSGNGGESFLDVYDVGNYPIGNVKFLYVSANGTNISGFRQRINNPLYIGLTRLQKRSLQPETWHYHIF